MSNRPAGSNADQIQETRRTPDEGLKNVDEKLFESSWGSMGARASDIEGLSNFPAQDRGLMQNLKEALADNDLKGFAKEIQLLAEDPEQFKRIIRNMDMHFSMLSKNSPVNFSTRFPIDISLMKDGNVLMFLPSEDKLGLTINPTTGEPSVVLTYEDDGKRVVRPVGDKALAETFGALSDRMNMMNYELPKPGKEVLSRQGYNLPDVQIN